MPLDSIKLTGITWNHSRGFVPMVATAQRFGELNPSVEIDWSKRSLQDFADKPLGKLAENFDLLVIDHPWAGFVAEQDILVPLDDYLPSGYLEEQKNGSVGASFQSYSWNAHQWALPIDAATPVACSRPDLLEKFSLKLPGTWEDVLAMATAGHVIFPAIPIDTLMNFYMFCIAFGEKPFAGGRELVSRKVGMKALEALRELAKRVDPVCFELNPIKVYELMSAKEQYAYCPFAYSYSNYSRKGYASSLLRFHDLVNITATEKLTSTLGGTGLAVSARCKHIEVAVEYAAYVASEECQQTLYFDSGGQPGHRLAWTGSHGNSHSFDFFKETLPAHERAFLRPRHNGYMAFQDGAGSPIRDFMMQGGDPGKVWEALNLLYLRTAPALKDTVQ